VNQQLNITLSEDELKTRNKVCQKGIKSVDFEVFRLDKAEFQSEQMKFDGL